MLIGTEKYFKLIWKIKPKTEKEWIDYITKHTDNEFNINIFKSIYHSFATEFRVYQFIQNIYGWKVKKANNFFDKYHQIDLITLNKQNQIILIQVKNKFYHNWKVDWKVNKIKNFAIKNNYLAYLAISTPKKIYLKRIV